METIDNTNGEIAAPGDNSAPAGASPAQRTPEATETADPSTRAAAAAPAKPETSIPLTEHERIIGGFHKRVDELSWARAYDPDTVRRAVTLMEQQERVDREGRARAQTPPEPQPDAKDPTSGELFYTPKQAAAWAVWRADQLFAAKVEELTGRLGPLEERFAASDKQESLGRQIEAAAAWPAFAENVDEITAAIVQANKENRKLTLEDAYIRIVAPKLAASKEITYAEATKAVLAKMNDTNAAAHDEVNPSRQPGSARKPYDKMTTREIVTETRKELEAKVAKAS